MLTFFHHSLVAFSTSSYSITRKCARTASYYNHAIKHKTSAKNGSKKNCRRRTFDLSSSTTMSGAIPMLSYEKIVHCYQFQHQFSHDYVWPRWRSEPLEGSAGGKNRRWTTPSSSDPNEAAIIEQSEPTLPSPIDPEATNRNWILVNPNEATTAQISQALREAHYRLDSQQFARTRGGWSMGRFLAFTSNLCKTITSNWSGV